VFAARLYKYFFDNACTLLVVGRDIARRDASSGVSRGAQTHRRSALRCVVPHFGVRDRDRRLLSVDFDRLPTSHPYTLMLPQDETERLLREAIGRRGGEILWGHEVRKITQDTSGFEITVRAAQRNERLRAQFLVGCDGAHSMVRETLGMRFEGATYPQSFVLADVRTAWGLPDDEVQLFLSPGGLVVVAPLRHGHHRVVASVDEALPEPSLNDLQALLDARGPRVPRPVVEEVVWSSPFRVHHRIAAAFREGAIFLRADAAHVHSPAGGQGMNTGIQDAFNLAWKLALVHRGLAHPALFGSYDAERRPEGRRVVRATDLLTRTITMRNPAARTLRNLVLPRVTALEPVCERIRGNLSQIRVGYRGSPIVRDGVSAERGGTPGTLGSRLWHQTGPEPGDRALDATMLRPDAKEAIRLSEITKGRWSSLRIVRSLGHDRLAGMRASAAAAGRRIDSAGSYHSETASRAGFRRSE
jgi:2-polyprenyl-6-methoxyphenol hydroxylase-like FAD-dependent oxidoreductase